MRGPNPKAGPAQGQLDLFAIDPAANLFERLDSIGDWPSQERFPVNRSGARVRDVVFTDLVESPSPVMVAGFSSLAEFVNLVALWSPNHEEGVLRFLIGAEPFATTTRSYADPEYAFTAEVERYWLEKGVSLHLCTKVVIALDAVRAGRVSARAVHGATPAHAKIYVGEDAATVGSSNFTRQGLATQVEANARFDRRHDPARYRDLSSVAENLWRAGRPWDDELAALLQQLLQVVSWKEALGRACAELLEGDWAQRFLDRSGGDRLWPSQLAGIARALWVIDTVGSVLVADATGSGKTRMGAHLVRAVQDRRWSTGRARSGLTVLVCPPAVQGTWDAESVACQVTMRTISHGQLSRADGDGVRQATDLSSVNGAQLLAVDEAHNFLNAGSKRTQFLRRNLADHVMLLTATPISRGAADLLDLVALLGPDNFDDETHEVLHHLDRRGRALDPAQEELLRSEIQRFTVRRTKSQINTLVERDPDSYLHPSTGRTCRYPRHDARSYRTGESDSDTTAAEAVREATAELAGIAWLPKSIAVPPSQRALVSDQQWLEFRLRSAAGLATHHVLGAMRSSRAALHEHLHGTDAATARFGLRPGFKQDGTGDTIASVTARAEARRPEVQLDTSLPEWLVDDRAWRERCEFELEVYAAIAVQAERLSDRRESTKAALLRELSQRHHRVLAFDRHLITLAVLYEHLEGVLDRPVVVATGQSATRDRVERMFSPEADGRAVALCSDAMSEGLNLQGASAMVHLDLPTTLRVAEQRVGRVDRMNSPHDTIEAWWPDDGPAFATRANERLARRIEDSERLLGSNMAVPDVLRIGGLGSDATITAGQIQAELAHVEDDPDDRLHDALEPVNQLIRGPDALVGEKDYDRYRRTGARVLARVAPVDAFEPWAFLSIRAPLTGAPRWVLVDPVERSCITDLSAVVDGLRDRLDSRPPNHRLDDSAAQWLSKCLDLAAEAEVQLLPRRMQRALQQMRTVTGEWAIRSRARGDEPGARIWSRLEQATQPERGASTADPHAVAERWLRLVQPTLERHRAENPRRRYVLLRDITNRLIAEPLPLDLVMESFSDVPSAAPLDERVSACIVGVPTEPFTAVEASG